jgi:hypothetical protein
MFLCYLIALSVGIEVGYSQPALRFNDLNAGNTLTATVSHDVGIISIALSGKTAFYSGENPGYSFNQTGIRLELYRRAWRISPIIGVGSDYATRSLNKNSEHGFAFNYGIGFLINFHVNRVHIFPKFYYTGITDFLQQGGFINASLGVDYEL